MVGTSNRYFIGELMDTAHAFVLKADDEMDRLLNMRNAGFHETIMAHPK